MQMFRSSGGILSALFAFLAVCLCFVLARNIETASSSAATLARQRRTADLNTCDLVKTFFQSRNIQLDTPHDTPKGSICGGQCCGAEAEMVLRRQGQDVFATMLRHNSMSLQGLLNSTATTLLNHVTEITGQSENNTLHLFSQVLRERSTLSRAPIKAFYTDITKAVQIEQHQDAVTNPNVDIHTSVTKFFTDIFPLVYHHITTLPRDFSAEYKRCLRETFPEIQPFGDIPRQVSQSLTKSLDASRLLLQAFSVGVEVLNATEDLVVDENGKLNVECHDSLMKMTYCPKCVGLEAKPCSGYCLNVLRGCLTKYVAELDSPWNGYVEGIERLVTAMRQHNNEAGVNVDLVIKGLYTRISEAIMRVMDKNWDMETKVKKACGSHKMDSMNSSLAAEAVDEEGEGYRPPAHARQPQDMQMSQFLTSIAKSRSFYGNLADNLCKDESFAVTKDQNCWNGERIGEYTKTVVDAGLDMQKYNPEVKPGTNLQNVDNRVANLADKLRHVHQMVMSSLGAIGLPESDNYMQGDGTDGSGSGDGNDVPEDDDDDQVRGSGSGDKQNDIKEPSITPNVNFPNAESPKKTSGSTRFEAPAVFLLSCYAIFLRFA